VAKHNKSKDPKINYQKQQHQQMQRAQREEAPQPASQACADDQITVQFHALDTWFFRESRPHDAVGASELASLFPPPVRTLAGALRTYIGEQLNIDWQTLTASLPGFDFKTALGGHDDLGQLQLNGPWIVYRGQRLYPAPLYLMHQADDIQRLRVGKVVRCDLGNVRLPELAPGLKGYKTLEQRWLTASGLAKCLNGKTPAQDEIISPAQLFNHETRLGIARDNPSRRVQDGKLYQTRHLRIKDDVHIELDVNRFDAALAELFRERTPKTLLRLGGEGRMANLTAQLQREPLPMADAQAQAKATEALLIHFITAADFNGRMFPKHFEEIDRGGQTVWQGEINGIALTVEAAVNGKVHREGGWDMRNHRPRPVKSYIPAGSAWFCRLDQPSDWPTLYDRLHGHCLGHDTAFGRGQILLGHWQDSFNA
jgi:CRISPR-associated protein Cmr3